MNWRCVAGSALNSTRCGATCGAKPIRAGSGTPLITTRARSWPMYLDDGRTRFFWNSKRCWRPLASRAISPTGGGLRAACGGGATHDWEGTYAENREQAYQLAHADQAVGPPD